MAILKFTCKPFIIRRLTGCRFYCNAGVSEKKIRNIGVMAHIDAGKTTTTERMLFYSGKINAMGDVHHGNTVTDFMEQERNRGITIASAFVTFNWNDYVFNLVDTPGHIDFTMEVEQSLKVMDSSVLILDATAGVEAQTCTVWKQAEIHKLPRLIYLNKMDRPTANLEMSLQSLKDKFDCQPYLLHLPISDQNTFIGLIDLISLKEVVWKEGKIISKTLEKDDSTYKKAVNLKLELVDLLSSTDDDLANKILERGSLELILDQEIKKSLRKACISLQGFPIICGSSYKNIGVQTLMDSVIDYLPSPLEANAKHLHFSNQLLARSFKIIHEKQRGAITFFRIYSGEINKGQKVFNASKQQTDNIGKLLIPFADDFEEISSTGTNSFVAATGMKETLSGDVICSTNASLKRFKEHLSKTLSVAEVENILHIENKIPDPVFFCSVEPSSQAYQTKLDKALEELEKEDPSLRISNNAETGQTILAGMGELHMEIIKDRIRSDYNVEADLGPIQIVYKEELLQLITGSNTLKSSLSSKEQLVSLSITLKPGVKKEFLTMDLTSESETNLSHLSPKIISAIKRGIETALRKGPLYSSQVINTHAVLHSLKISPRTPEPLIIAAAAQCIDKMLKESLTMLLEPYMTVNIYLPEKYLSFVVSDLSKRRGVINNIEGKGDYKEISCEAPLSQLLGYAKHIRTITSGTANLSIAFLNYQQMSNEQVETLKKYGSI